MLRDWEEFDKYYADEQTKHPSIRRFIQKNTNINRTLEPPKISESRAYVEEPDGGIILTQRDLFRQEKLRDKYFDKSEAQSANSDAPQNPNPPEAIVEGN